MTCDPNQLISDARCILQCIPPGLQMSSQTALLDMINGGPTPTNTLIQNAKEFIWRVPPRMQVPLQIYLLLVVLEGQNRTVDELLRSASCMRCIPQGLHPPIQTSEICQWSTPSSACKDSQVDNWVARIAADPLAVVPPQNIIDAVCVFCQDLRAANIFSKMLFVNPFIPPTDGTAKSLRAMMYNLFYTNIAGDSFFNQTGFSIADLNTDGLKGDGSSKYISTGFVPLAHWGLQTTSGGISIYTPTTTVGDPVDAIEIGNRETDAGISEFSLAAYINSAGGTQAICWWNPPPLSVSTVVEKPSFYSMNRISNTDFRLYRASSSFLFQQIGFLAADQIGKPVPGYDMFVFAVNEDGSPINFSAKRISFVAVHDGLNPFESRDLFNAVHKMRVSFGGGWA